MLVKIFQVNGSLTSTLVFLSLGKVCRIMMQEPSNSIMHYHESRMNRARKTFPTSSISSDI